MPEPVAMDFNELGRLIAAELDSGMQSINTSSPWSGKFHIASMHVRLGQAEIDSPSETGEEAPLPAEKMFLLHDRYPLAKQGWMFELELAAGAAPTKFQAQGKPPVTLPTQLQRSAIELFGDLPVNSIKGINSSWSLILLKAGIKTIDDLVKIKNKLLMELVRTYSKKHPIALHTKARLLNTVIPGIPVSPIDQFTLYSLLTVSPVSLRRKIGKQRFSASSSEQLSELLALLYTVLDSRILKKYTVQSLRTRQYSRQG